MLKCNICGSEIHRFGNDPLGKYGEPAYCDNCGGFPCECEHCGGFIAQDNPREIDARCSCGRHDVYILTKNGLGG